MAAFLCEAFGLSDRAWLNTAHQGPLPLAAAQAARAAIEQKLDPRLMPEEAFFEVPQRLRATLGRLVQADPREIVLANRMADGLVVEARDYWHLADGHRRPTGTLFLPD